jgi:D-glycero-D-manno-heptose 1,7-bisphosphate phosphatase
MLIWINSPRPRSRRFLFLDRDGVINADSPDYIKHWGEFRFYPDALDALRWLHKREINVILISNQSALRRGLTTPEDFWDLHRRMIRAVRQAGGDILATFYCPHRPDEKCPCRKPSPAMILAASNLFAIPLEDTYMIGDRPTDIQAGAQAGCRGIMLERFTGDQAYPAPLAGATAHGQYGSLFEAVTSLWKDG